jgi:hypothetical protein
MPLKARLKTARYSIVTAQAWSGTETYLRHEKDQSRAPIPPPNQASITRVTTQSRAHISPSGSAQRMPNLACQSVPNGGYASGGRSPGSRRSVPVVGERK